jgi:hypothetical protein
MKNLLFLFLLFTSCEVIDSPDVFEGTLPCQVTGQPESFCSVNITHTENLCVLTVEDDYAPDYGTIEYLLVIQYYIDDVFYCNYLNESNPRTFFVPKYQLEDARLHIVRTVIDDNGYGEIINQVESVLFRVKNCIIR